jgi:hypothetical protein
MNVIRKATAYLSTIVVIAVIIAMFTVPSKEKLQQQLAATYGDSLRITITENSFKLIVPVVTSCKYSVTGTPKQFTLHPNDSVNKPLYLANIIKSGVYLGLFGRFWQWK